MIVSLCYHQRLFPPPPPARKLLPSADTTSTYAISSHSADHYTVSSLSTTFTDSPAVAFSDYQRLFTSQRSETSTEPILLQLVEGSIPDDFPMGTYYLAGPGIFSDDDGSTVHPLDGHGYLRVFRFGGGGGAVWYSARYVTTEALREERDERTGQWRFTHRGPFSVLRRGKRVGNMKVMKNVANTSVLRWGGRLMCLWEGGGPYEIDPLTLDTLGPVNLVRTEQDRTSSNGGGAAGKSVADCTPNIMAQLIKHILGMLKLPEERMLAHYKIDQKRERLVMVSCNTEDMLHPPTHLTFYEFDLKFEIKNKKEYVIPDHIMIHDWGLTENHFLLVANRIKLDPPNTLLAVLGLQPMVSALAVNPQRNKLSTQIYLLPRFSSDDDAFGGHDHHHHHHQGRRRDWRVPVEVPEQLWALHVPNAFEETTNAAGSTNIHLQLSVCSYEWFNFHKMFGYNWRTGLLEPSFMNLAEGKEQLLAHLVQVSLELDLSGRFRGCSVSNASNRWNRPADFPMINPLFSGKRNTYIYQAAASGDRPFLPHFPFDSIVKINLADGSAMSWSPGGHRAFVGEPIFVPRCQSVEEDDGYILVIEYAVSRQRCYLTVLDARQIGRKDEVVAKLEVPKHLTFPMGFHGFWSAS